MYTNNYTQDILGENLEQCIIPLKDDYEGKVIGTLIRKKANIHTEKAILYVHGFNDYFFQKELAVQFNDHKLNFYAIDLRKYGRSLLPHQTFNDIRDIKAYYEEILKALNIIHKEGNNTVLLMGHSTGGLILTLFAKDYSGSNLFDGLILNSPFYEFNLPIFAKALIPVISALGHIFPSMKIKGGFTEEYGKSIHNSYYGEWKYNLEWKPNTAPAVNLGWIRAIYKAQKELKKPFYIKQPVLVLHSKTSTKNYKSKEQISTSDAILNVKQIERIAQNITGNVEIKSIKGGLHDLVLSSARVRDYVYTTIFEWINRKES